jgi:hypothetical protein
MIDRLTAAAPAITPETGPGRKVLRMIANDRTAGSIPSWDYPVTPHQQVEQALGMAQAGTTGTSENMLAYRPDFRSAQDEAFGFADLIDMVNPLQHIPLVNHLYRKLTGDGIKPAGKLVGGTVFAGPAGLAGGIVNLIVEKETGRDITGNALALVTRGERPRLIGDSLSSENTQKDLPGALLAFADLRRDPDIRIAQISSAGAKTTSQPAFKRPVWERD